MSRPNFSVAYPDKAPCYMESESIDDQVGFYSPSAQPHLSDINGRAETPAAADQRFADVRPKD